MHLLFYISFPFGSNQLICTSERGKAKALFKLHLILALRESLKRKSIGLEPLLEWRGDPSLVSWFWEKFMDRKLLQFFCLDSSNLVNAFYCTWSYQRAPIKISVQILDCSSQRSHYATFSFVFKSSRLRQETSTSIEQLQWKKFVAYKFIVNKLKV